MHRHGASVEVDACAEVDARANPFFFTKIKDTKTRHAVDIVLCVWCVARGVR